MAIERNQEIQQSVKDARTADAKVSEFFTSTGASMVSLAVMAVVVLIEPWTFHFLSVWALAWWVSVVNEKARRVLPFALPIRAKTKDLNLPKDGTQSGYKMAEGVFFLGNAIDRYFEIWETSSHARQHHLVLGTTGAGKSELLSGFYANYLLFGSGCFFSDAKGTTEQVSKFWTLNRRFGRDPDFFSVFYGSGGDTIRSGRRDRLSHMVNPVGRASADQINNLFLSFLPKGSGDNQIFQDRATTMFTSITPALVDLRDLHGESLTIPKIRRLLNSLHNILDLALDPEQRLTRRSREILISWVQSLNIEWPAYEASRKGAAAGRGAAKPYEINAETFKQFGYAQNYFTRALSSLADTYGHIYDCEVPDVDYIDALLNRRFVMISLPSLEKAGAELNNLAKINIANIRGAIAVLTGSRVEGLASEVIDNSLSKSEVPTGLILDEFGYQNPGEGVGITLAQARGLGLSITLAGQDEANFMMGSKEEGEAIFGNAMLIVMFVRNVKTLVERIRDMVGEADVAVESGFERNPGLISGFRSRRDVGVQRRARLTGSDIFGLEKTGHAFLILGRGLGIVKYAPFAPLPTAAPEFVLNRFLPAVFDELKLSDGVEIAKRFTAFVQGRAEGTQSAPAGDDDLTRMPRLMWRAMNAAGQSGGRGWAEQVRKMLSPGSAAAATAGSPLPARTGAALYGAAAVTSDTNLPPAGRQLPPPPRDIDPPAPPSEPVQPPPQPPPASAPAAVAQPPVGEPVPVETSVRDAVSRIRSGVSASRSSAAPTPPEASAEPFPPPLSAGADLFAPGGLDGYPHDDDDAWNHESVDRMPLTLDIPTSVESDYLETQRMVSELDEETEDDAVGDIDDATVTSNIERAAGDFDAAVRAHDPVAKSQRMPGAVRHRDLTAAIKESAKYQPSPDAPSEPMDPSTVRDALGRIFATVKMRRQTDKQDT